MTKKKYEPNTCKQCGKSDTFVSTRHLCYECGAKNMHKNIDELMHKEGPTYEKWKAAMQKAVEKLR